MYKDKAKQREANVEWEQVRCKYCGKDLDNVPGKVQKQFCSDAHRKASKRLELRATGSPSVDELRTDGTKQPRTSTSDKPKKTERGNIRVSKPGDADYVPQCETTKAFIESGQGTSAPPVRCAVMDSSVDPPKRGRDIKVFNDLPPDVQQTIRTISESNEEFKRRTVIAIAYQHTFPERY